ncbi:MAG: ABC transporter ATP-binding protein [Haloarculaceae archaeon]
MTPAASEQGGTSTVVACSDVTRRYSRGRGDDEGVEALSEVSLSVAASEFVGVTGPSGSGKSTLLHLLGALDTPTAGRIELAGTDVTDLPERDRARLRLRHVGLVFQRFHLLPALSARANVALPLVERGVPKSTRRERATRQLERVELGDRLTHRPGELSGGEQQRVAVARALVTDPDLLIADEPTGELDTSTGRRVLELLATLAADESDCAVVMASHDPQAIDAADRVVRLRDGRRVENLDDRLLGETAAPADDG